MLESNKATMAHFLHRLYKDIKDIVELYHYATIDDLKRYLTSRKSYPNVPNSWRGKEKNKERPRKEKVIRKGVSYPKAGKRRGHYLVQLLHPKVATSNEDGTIDSDSSRTKSTSISNLDASSECSPNEEGDLLMVRCLMSAQVGKNDESQRENIFHSSFHFVGSSVNIASSRLVEKLKLPTLAHPRPYKLQWLNNEGELAFMK
ncbi:hypothetical protein CR513_60084, partial [Mucuna pruriens]